MGFVCELEEKTSFIYKAPFDNGLTEHELDHVMVGYYNENPQDSQRLPLEEVVRYLDR